MKILVCNHDGAIVERIRNHFSEAPRGIKRILSANCTQSAESLLIDETPDVVLADIGDTLCNGLEILKCARNRGIQCEFLLLVGYEDFPLIRESIRQGIRYYLTKPLDLAQLDEELYQIIDARKQEDLHRIGISVSRSSQSLVFNGILRGLRDNLYGNDRKLLDASLRKHNLNVKATDQYRWVLVYGETVEALNKAWTLGALCYSFAYLSQEVIADRLDFKNAIIENFETTIKVYSLLPANKFTEEELKERCQRFCTISYAYTGISPVCIIGEAMPLYMTNTATKRLGAKLRRCYFRKGSTFTSDDKLPANGAVPKEISEEKLLFYLKKQDKQGYLDFVSSYIQRLADDHEDDGLQMMILHHGLLQSFYQCIRDNQLSPHLIFCDDDIREADAKAERSSADLIQFAQMLFDRVQVLLANRDDTFNAIEIARKYIQNHFREGIDRDAVAEVACITPNYLSKRFRAETGCGLREYVNQLRISEAKRLLLSTNKTVSEIAGEVGFDNISYFSTVFRRLCGMSPGDWKEQKHDILI